MWIRYIFALWPNPLSIEHPYSVCSKIASKHWFEGHHYSISLSLSLSLCRWPFRTSAVQYSRMNSDAKSDSAARIRDARTRLNASQMACTCPTKSPCQIAAENFCAPTTPVALMALSQSAIVLAQKRNRSVKIVASNLISSKTGTPDYPHFV